ncbi:MAG: TetR/AcrR family transcriptional regulator C-terminal domain-containing protein [Oscillospiraceae bacterium]|nr:TetR/AcrR family transcriptional regulator C-terminal domain-containing protein [Oscillospiraceae bacterium]
MADSNTTKWALATVIKEELQEQPLEKISISVLCERCHMNRKSFYYHFRDKYDLANWIFDSEVLEQRAQLLQQLLEPRDQEDFWQSMEELCSYFYENRVFYRRVLKGNGQNPFVVHFRSAVGQLLRLQVEQVPDMTCDFMVDSILSILERWLLERDCAPVEDFLENLRQLYLLQYRLILSWAARESVPLD